MYFPVLNILTITRDKLGAYFARAAEDDYIDIAFLVENYSQSARAVHGQLDRNHCQRFLSVYKSRDKGTKDPIDRVRYVLCVM